MLMMVLISYEALISLTSVVSLKMSVKCATHLLFICQFSWSISLIHCWIVNFVSGSAFSKSSSSSWPDCLNFLNGFYSCHFKHDLIVASSSDWSTEVPEDVGCCSLEENLGLLLRANFLFLTPACLEAIDPISVILGRSIMFTILKGLEIFSRPSIP